MSVSDVTDGYHLTGFVEAFSKMEGKALAGQVSTVLSHPSVFVFGELLALSNVKKVRTHLLWHRKHAPLVR